jgi:GTP-binding protein
MFVDKAKIYIKAGDGGDGIVAFRREKYVPDGGPAGGDGGRGGNVIFRVDEGLRTLMDFRYQKHFKAQPGEKGRNKSMHGANADHYIVRVPPGTIVMDDDTHEIIADMIEHNQEVVIAKGGRGGRGNIRFATAQNPAPEIAENGEEGQERWVTLELKVLADVGLVGFPSVGKSTLLSVVSAAKPKIASYPFTTLSPNLGVVDAGDGKSFVMADLPGLIEGAHQGVGLGHEFLRHIERTRIIVHVVDMSASDGRDPYEDFISINNELSLYSEVLQSRPQIVVANKMDMPDAQFHIEQFKQRALDDQKQLKILEISAMTRQGIQSLLFEIQRVLDTIPVQPIIDDMKSLQKRKVFRIQKQDDMDYTITEDSGVFVIQSLSIEKLIKRTNFSTQDSIDRFARILRKKGIDQELRNRGAEDGDTIRIGDIEFEFLEKG